MKRIGIIMTILFGNIIFGVDYNYLKPGHEQYQDIIINNVVVSKGVRQCARRYDAIVQFLKKYNRPFTMLDIGASQGYFSFRAAHDFPTSTCIMIEGNYNDKYKIAQQLQDLCELNTDLNNIIFLQKRVSVEDMQKMAECEHIDVTLVFNVAHHFGSSWKSFLDAIFSLGDHVIIETPTAQEHVLGGPIEKYIIDKGGVLMCETPRHTNPNFKGKMYLVEGKKDKIIKSYMMQPLIKEDRWRIESNFDVKYLTKETKTGTTRVNWVPGINLLTFKLLNGTYPKLDDLYVELQRPDYAQHPDPFIWNMILQGKEITFIDADPELAGQFDVQAVHAMNKRMLYMNRQDILDFFNTNQHIKATKRYIQRLEQRLTQSCA